MELLDRQIYEHLNFLYGKDKADTFTPRLLNKLAVFRKEHSDLVAPAQAQRLSEKDTILITYGDMIRREGENPLRTLAGFLEKYLAGVVSTVHILPFFPYSSDDGFSVVDYYRVNPALGNWDDITRIGQRFRLMFDLVINHVSVESDWFKGFLADDPKYRDFFIVVDEETDLSNVFRPRAKPLLTPFETAAGRKLVWTTFSTDQADLNFRNPEVLLAVIDILLDYVAHGAEFIRLDAVTFVWKEIGTSCINLPQTHRFVQLLRSVLNLAAPHVTIITETNVPHNENISYFGDGRNEAQMVYNFALPILTLHAFHHENTEALSSWAATLELPSDETAFFNFLAGHDGIGILPAKGILPENELDELAEITKQQGGAVSYKNNPDGSQSPYELNINFFDALGSPADDELGGNRIVKRFLASQAIMLALRGVPGIYFHSLIGSHNWLEGVALTGRKRTINREKVSADALERALQDPHSMRHRIFFGYLKMLRLRNATRAFHPYGEQIVVHAGTSVFAFVRISPDGAERVLCLHNVSSRKQKITLSVGKKGFLEHGMLRDLLGQSRVEINQGILTLEMEPFQVMWLKADDAGKRNA